MRGGSRIGGWALATCVVASLALAAGPAQAATINVNTTQDEFDTGTGCSLREAIQAANHDSAFGGCSAGSGADTINLQASTAYPEQRGGCGAGGFNSDDNNVCGDFDISGDLTIQGAGAGSTTVDAHGIDRVFQIPPNVTVVINQVTIQGGGPNPQSGSDFTGGGILNAGILTLNNDVITRNRTDAKITSSPGADGGGVWSSGPLALNGTSVDHNNAGFARTASNGGNGGGIADSGSGTLTVSGSTIANNSGGQGGASSGDAGNGGKGGGIYDTSSGAVSISGSTISANGAGSAFGTGDGGSGGGIYASGAGTVTISASTINGNGAGGSVTGDGGPGGGLSLSGGTLVLTNSTLASNTAGSSTNLVGGSGGGVSVTGASTSATLTNDTIALNGAGTGPINNGAGGGVARSAGTATLANTIVASSMRGGNCAGTITDGSHNVGWGDATCPAGFASGNPTLGPLQGNGGPTQTMSIAGPVAVDQVPAAGANCPAADQRGIPRPQGPACDIGAFEVVNPITLSVSKGGTGSGMVTSSPAGIDCGATCSAQYTQHSSVTLTATPAAGSTFSGWSGACSGTGACTVALEANAAVGASFTAIKPPPGVAPNTKIKRAKINQAKNSATFKFKSIGGSKAKPTRGFQCALVKKKHRKPKFKACTSPKKYKHLKPHRYTFEVRAFDAAGKDATPAKKKFRIR